MSWVTVAWTAAITACVTLALQNVLVWLKDRTARAHLLFAMATAATAAIGACELLAMRATTAERYGLVLRWGQVVFLVIYVSLVWFVRLYLDAGRPWLAWTAIGTRAFATLRESEHRMTLAASAAEIGTWVWDIARGEVWVTRMGRVLRGFGESAPLTFDRFLRSVHPDDRDSVREAVEWSLKEGADFEREYRVVRKDGQTRWIAARGAVERDAAGTPVRMRGVSLDITRRKTAELGVLEQRSELAHLSRVTMVGELSGSLAHELNQPLTAILSNAQAAQRLLARESPDLGEVREILKDIVDEDKRAGEVIRGPGDGEDESGVAGRSRAPRRSGGSPAGLAP